MKGVVFCEFLKMVDTTISPDMTETIIDKSDLPSGGAYTSVGTYDHQEIISLVVALSEETGTPIPTLVNAFGNYLFGRFVDTQPQFFENTTDCFTFVEGIDDYIHVEVKKLYPDAELPKINAKRVSDNELEVVYISNRKMGDLAEGLLEACIKYFNENISIKRTELDNDSQQAQSTMFYLSRQ